MKVFKLIFGLCLFCIVSLDLKAQETSLPIQNDSLTLAQAYINLSITETYFGKINNDRLSKIISFEESELKLLKNKDFIENNIGLYNFAYSLLNYNKAKLINRDKSNLNREVLKNWYNTLKQSILMFQDAQYQLNFQFIAEENVFFDLINFNKYSFENLSYDITNLKEEFTPYFNNDIYPDFKKLFKKAKKHTKYDFEALKSFAAIYNLQLNMSILNNDAEDYDDAPNRGFSYIDNSYVLDLKLDLISRYLQIKYYLTLEENKIPQDLNLHNLYKSYYIFRDEIALAYYFKDDNFFKKELNRKICDNLLTELRNKFPHDFIDEYNSTQDMLSLNSKPPVKYFFPNPAPMPSASLTIKNFKPELDTLGKVDIYLKEKLKKAGYEQGRLHYYYDLDGFALTTSLEKFNIDGIKIEDEKRWVKNIGGDGKFSYYEIFKSLFFEVESEFRMFAFVVASKNVTISNNSMSAGQAEELLKNSYPSLPEDLKNVSLPNKNFTILIYHFHQNDIGQVPMLNLSGKMNAENYLKNAELSDLLQK